MKYTTEKDRMKRIEQIRKEVMTSKEVVEFLGVSRMRLSQLSREGKITPIRDGFYLKDDIIAYKNTRKRQAKKEG